MSIRINTNIPAMTALRNIGLNDSNMAQTINRLSTGLRINSAADDPAGLIISEGMRAQLKGLEVAVRNSQDAVNLSKTAEGALDEVQRLLRDMRGIAVHSANTAVVDNAQLQANQKQLQSAIESINRIAESTQWGSRRLLNGTAGVVANLTDATNLSGMFFGSTFGGFPVAGGTVTISQTTPARQEELVTNITRTSGTVLPAGSFVINGYTFTTNGTTDDIDAVMAKINEAIPNTGIRATVVSNNLVLTSMEYGADFPINFFDPNGVFNSTPNPTATTTGQDAVADVTVMVTNPDGTTSPSTQTFTGGQGQGVSGLRVSDQYGNAITLTPTGNSTGTLSGGVGVLTAGAMRFQIGPMANQAVSFGLPDVRANRLGTDLIAGKDLSSIDVTNASGATEALKIVDKAIEQLSSARGDLGAFQKNFLESTVRSLEVAKENLTATESSIRDADVAEEMSNFTRQQILAQSGMAVLAQANSTPRTVLQLLGGG